MGPLSVNQTQKPQNPKAHNTLTANEHPPTLNSAEDEDEALQEPCLKGTRLGALSP